jgi:hypothetical protein
LQIHEEIFNIPSHKGNADQNDIEISSHPNQNDYHQHKQRMLARMQERKMNPDTCLVGM